MTGDGTRVLTRPRTTAQRITLREADAIRAAVAAGEHPETVAWRFRRSGQTVRLLVRAGRRVAA